MPIWDQTIVFPAYEDPAATVAAPDWSVGGLMNTPVRLSTLEVKAFHGLEHQVHHVAISYRYGDGDKVSATRHIPHYTFDLQRDRSPTLKAHALWVVKAEWGHLDFVLSPWPSSSTLLLSTLDGDPVELQPRSYS